MTAVRHKTIHVLFVCLGNICRSPMAEGVFRHLVEQAQLNGQIKTDSAGTGAWHVGEPPHSGTLKVLHDRSINYIHHSRQVQRDDFLHFDYIIAMDSDNFYDLKRMRQGSSAKLHKLLEFAPNLGVSDVPDPYYTGRFEEVYRLVDAACRGLLNHIIQKEGLSS